jgi:hypothetical protein
MLESKETCIIRQSLMIGGGGGGGKPMAALKEGSGTVP